jgi:hypothetical protein
MTMSSRMPIPNICILATPSEPARNGSGCSGQAFRANHDRSEDQDDNELKYVLHPNYPLRIRRGPGRSCSKPRKQDYPKHNYAAQAQGDAPEALSAKTPQTSPCSLRVRSRAAPPHPWVRKMLGVSPQHPPHMALRGPQDAAAPLRTPLVCAPPPTRNDAVHAALCGLRLSSLLRLRRGGWGEVTHAPLSHLGWIPPNVGMTYRPRAAAKNQALRLALFASLRKTASCLRCRGL